VDGTLHMENGLVLPGEPVSVASGAAFEVSGAVQRQVSGVGQIVATGTLVMGDSTDPNTFLFAGTLDVGDNTVLLLESDQIQLGTLTTVTGGVLASENGIALASTAQLQGTGVVVGGFVNEGVVTGGAGTDVLTFTGDVSSTGNFVGNVQFAGPFSPGSSPASISLENSIFSRFSQLIIEIGGPVPGSDYDQLNHILGEGVADLGGTLEVQLIDGFVPATGDVFEIITASGEIMNEFERERLPFLGGGLTLDVVYGVNLVTLAVSGVAGDYNFDGTVNAADYTVWRSP